MSKYPKYVEVNGRKYNINTDFRVAIRCNQIATDENIGDVERALGVICTLFGEDSINYQDDYELLLKLAKKYLSCGKELDNASDGEVDMDYIQDMDYIEASFMSDYGIDLSTTDMHWYKFSNLINGLSNSEFGNCCVLNRIRNIRNFNLNDINDPKEKDKILKMKNQFALKKTKKITEEQKESVDEFYKALGF